MARGKYAARATIRRDTATLESAATDAERERDRLSAELAELRETSGRRIAALQAELSEARKQRDSAVAPVLDRVYTANSELRAEAERLRAEVKTAATHNQRLCDVITEAARAAGFSAPEAIGAQDGLADRSIPGRESRDKHFASAEHQVLFNEIRLAEPGFRRFLSSFYVSLVDKTWRIEGDVLIIDPWDRLIYERSVEKIRRERSQGEHQERTTRP